MLQDRAPLVDAPDGDIHALFLQAFRLEGLRLTLDLGKRPRPLLSGKVQSKVLDFADLAPVIGLPVKASANSPAGGGNRKAAKAATPVKKASKQTPTVAPGRVLPSTQLDLERLQAMNADVTYIAADVRHVEQLPLDKGSAHIRLTNGILSLDPVSLGVAGGRSEGARARRPHGEPSL